MAQALPSRPTAADIQRQYREELNVLVADLKDVADQINRHTQAIQQLKLKRQRLLTRKNRVQYFVDNPPRSDKGVPSGTEQGTVPCPQCLRCAGPTVRAGFSSGTRKQMFRCVNKTCAMVFTDPAVSGKRRKETPTGLLCHRCNGLETSYRGKGKDSGLVGWCRTCKKEFTHGGRYDFRRHSHILEERVKSLGLGAALREMVLLQAKADVLAGLGYCSTVELKVRAAKVELTGPCQEQGSKKAYAIQTGEFLHEP